MPFVFLDLEASGLQNGFPTEVGWIRQSDGANYSTLIRPEPDWCENFNWDPGAEAVTGITREHLIARGRSRIEVAADLMRDLANDRVFVDGGRWDVEWLNMITAPSVIPLEDFDGLWAAATARGGWLGTAGAEALEKAVQRTVEAAGLREHRALDDARRMHIKFELAVAGPFKPKQ